MQPLLNQASTLSMEDMVFYNLVGNFAPPEWSGLVNASGKPWGLSEESKAMYA